MKLIFSSFILLLSLLAIGTRAELKENPCKLIAPVKYYVRYPSNMKKYIECSGDGKYAVKICEKEHEYFDIVHTECREVTSQREEKLILKKTCENDGLYSHIIYGVFRCVCDPLRFKGDRCEIDISKDFRFKGHNLTTAEEIINNRFCIMDYTKHTTEANFTIDHREYFASYNLSEEIFEKLEEYIETYENETVSVHYEVLLNSLFSDILRAIFPEHKFFIDLSSEINNSSDLDSVKNTLEKAIPLVLQYGTTAVLRSREIITSYKEVTRALVDYLREHAKSAPRLAERYYEFCLFVEQQNVTEFNEFYFKSGRPYVEENYRHQDFVKQVNLRFEQFFTSLINFEFIVSRKMAKLGGFLVGEIAKDFSECKIAKERIDEMAIAVSNLFKDLVNYGFWTVTNILVHPDLYDVIEV